MPLYLPRSLGALARLAARDNPRYAVHALRLRDTQDGNFRVDVTDGRRLAIVRGPSAPADYPAVEEFPADALEAFVDGSEWKEAFKLATGKHWKDRPVGVALGGGEFLFAVGAQTVRGVPVEGRFPMVEDVLPKRQPFFKVAVDARLLVELLEVAALFAADPTRPRVELFLYKPDAPFGVVTDNGSVFFDGIFMPLA